MGKYDSLRDYLINSGEAEVVLRFEVLSPLIPGHLPTSAYAYPAWWGNQIDTSGRPQEKAWSEAGYHVASVDLNQYVVRFHHNDPAALLPPKDDLQNTTAPVSGPELPVDNNAKQIPQDPRRSLGWLIPIAFIVLFIAWIVYFSLQPSECEQYCDGDPLCERACEIDEGRGDGRRRT